MQRLGKYALTKPVEDEHSAPLIARVKNLLELTTRESGGERVVFERSNQSASGAVFPPVPAIAEREDCTQATTSWMHLANKNVLFGFEACGGN